MALAPEPYLSACLDVLHCAALNARVMGWGKNVSPEHLADLMDAVHNIPWLIRKWEKCDERLLRETLAQYDAKWQGSLAWTYDRAVAAGS